MFSSNWGLDPNLAKKKNRASSGIFWWNIFIRKFQFVNAFQRSLLVLIKPSLGKIFSYAVHNFWSKPETDRLECTLPRCQWLEWTPIFCNSQIQILPLQQTGQPYDLKFLSSIRKAYMAAVIYYSLPFFQCEEDYVQHLISCEKEPHFDLSPEERLLSWYLAHVLVSIFVSRSMITRSRPSSGTAAVTWCICN